MYFYTTRSRLSTLNYRLASACLLLLCWFHISNGEKSTSSISNRRSARAEGDDFTFPDEVTPERLSQQKYHNHHHHHYEPNFHSHNHKELENPESKGYPKVEEPTNVNLNVSLQIPLEFVESINELDVNDVLSKYVEGADIGPNLQDRFGGTERKGGIIPQKATCMPELTTVKIAQSDDPSILYIPQCTRIPRCGGCCSHSLLSCQPQEVQLVNFEIFKTQFTGGKKLKSLGKEIVTVEKHVKCKCDCRMKPENCTKFQEYRKSECKCSCKNYDEEQKCHKNSARKLWDPNLCMCQCRQIMQCSTGSHFDQNECECKMTSFKRRNISPEKRSYRARIESEVFSNDT